MFHAVKKRSDKAPLVLEVSKYWDKKQLDLGIMCLHEEKYLSKPPGRGSPYLSFNKANQKTLDGVYIN